jgi:hypothetical protein
MGEKLFGGSSQFEGYTASEFRRLSPARRVMEMVSWFEANFVDPARIPSCETASHSYQWTDGGPYGAEEQISDEFYEVAQEDEIEQAVALVEKDGIYDWAMAP